MQTGIRAKYTPWDRSGQSAVVMVNVQADAHGSGCALQWVLASRVKMTMHRELMGISKAGNYSTGHHQPLTTIKRAFSTMHGKAVNHHSMPV